MLKYIKLWYYWNIKIRKNINHHNLNKLNIFVELKDKGNFSYDMLENILMCRYMIASKLSNNIPYNEISDELIQKAYL